MKDFAALCLIVMMTSTAFAETTVFNYQGKLSDLGNPANGVYQLRFSLFDAPVGGNQIGATVENTAVAVVPGVFIVRLDFGATVFSGADR